MEDVNNPDLTKRTITAVLGNAWELFFYDESDDDDMDEGNAECRGSKRRKIVNIYDFAEKIIPLQFNDQFQSHFRLNRETMQIVIECIGLRIDNNGKLIAGRRNVPVEKTLLICIWSLGNQETFRSVADRFGVSRSTAWECVRRVSSALPQLKTEKQIIKWPTGQRAVDVICEFKFPGVIGAIDGCHIEIAKPVQSHNAYINRKGYHSILLQGVCDSKLRFTDAYAGEVGSVHDACMFRRSELHTQMEHDENMFPNDSHLLGDSAYPISQHLLVPYRDNGRLDQRKKNFNRSLSSARVVIERAFAFLKGRFRRLKRLDMRRVDLIPQIIIASCILHNICIDCGNNLTEDEWGNDMVDNRDEVELEPLRNANRAEGVRKRDALAMML